MHVTTAAREVFLIPDKEASIVLVAASPPAAELEVAGRLLTISVAVSTPTATEVLAIIGVLIWVTGLLVLIALDVSRRARRHPQQYHQRGPSRLQRWARR